ncbi:MAG: 3'-5' exoribonuclease, partial [Anaerolineae bacterium]|nr:3'-5' exoribonuclease [Anaerolineae bacterium]
MHGELVAIDLETTGLDPSQDAIIEVGAVRMLNGEITAEYSTFVDPGIAVPPHVTHITGIRSQDLMGAPKLDAVLPQIQEFVGKRPIIAHNISFDMGFLQGRYKILLNNQRIDTYDLASVLLPRTPRYNLHSLTAEFKIQLLNAHRALDDARATALLYWQLWHKLLTLPRSTLQEIVEAARGLDWDVATVFETAVQLASPLQQNHATSMAFSPAQTSRLPLKPADERQGIEADEITQFMGETGILSQRLPGYEYRVQQLQMAEAITESFNQSHHLLVE